MDANSPHVFAVREIAHFQAPVPTNFTGPVLILTGRNDQIVCGNGSIADYVPNCGIGPGSNTSNTISLFEEASKFDAHSPVDTAHSLNSQYSAPKTFGAAHAWLQDVGF